MHTQILLFQGFFHIILGFLLLLSWGLNQMLNMDGREILQIGRKKVNDAGSENQSVGDLCFRK